VANLSHDMNVYGGVEVQRHLFLTSRLDCGEWSASLHGRLTPGESDLRSHWIGGWVGPRLSLDPYEDRNIPSWATFPLCPAPSLVTVPNS